jgi:hypothetical protein
MDYALLFGGIVLVLVLVSWQLTAASRAWVIRLRNGVPVLVKGRIAPSVVADLGEVLQRHGVRRGALYGVKRRGTIALGFSRTIPAGCRQALRNVWSMHAR